MTLSFLDKIIEWDKEIFLYLNAVNVDWMDPVMLMFSSLKVWVSVLVLVMCFMIYKRHKMGLWASLFLLISLAMNSIVNNIIKIIVLRPRPIHEEAFQGIIHAIEGQENSFSFYSGHSSNSFCLAIFTILFLRKKYYTCIIAIWATMVTYSRIYVGKHYPIDVLCGILFGTMMGIIGYKMFEKFREKKLEPTK